MGCSVHCLADDPRNRDVENMTTPSNPGERRLLHEHGRVQLGRPVDKIQVTRIIAFLETLTGEIKDELL